MAGPEKKDFRSPIEVYKQIPKQGREWYEKTEIPVHPVTEQLIASLPLSERVAEVRSRQINYWRPLLRLENPALYSEDNEPAQELLEIITDQQLRTREGKRRPNRANELLREANLDLFVHDYLLSPGAREQLVTALKDISTHTSLSPEDISRFLDEVTGRLQKVTTPEEARFLQYKPGSDNFHHRSQSESLSYLIDLNTSDKHAPGIPGQLARMGEAALEMYWRNIDHLYDQDELVPHTAFLHDYLYACSQTTDKDNFRIRSGWLLNKMKKVNKRVSGEIVMLESLRVREEIDLQRHLSRISQRPMMELPEFFIGLTDQDVEMFNNTRPESVAIGKYLDRAIGLEVALRMWADDPPNTWMVNVMAASYALENRGKDLAMFITIGMRAKITALKPLHMLYDESARLFYQEDVEAVNREFFAEKNREREIFPYEYFDQSRRSFYESTLQQSSANALLSERRMINEQLIQAVFFNECPKNDAELRELEDQNERLIRKIRDENNWFVALNGDQFASETNPELAGLNLQSVTFYPENFGKAGHRISLISGYQDKSGKPYTVTLLMDRQGNIEFPDVTNAYLHVWVTSRLRNFLLTRLDYITSGQANKDEETKTTIEPAKEGEEVLARRAHYRYLTSTPQHRYTLQSPQAKAHAEYVWQKYGINLRLENLWRRLRNTLGENQIITFVREVEKGDVPPNRLVYHLKEEN